KSGFSAALGIKTGPRPWHIAVVKIICPPFRGRSGPSPQYDEMLRFLARRLLQVVPALFGLLVLVFIMVRVVPNAPAAVLAGDNATPAQLAALRAQYGLDRSLVEQFYIYVHQIGSGSLGVSFLT